MTLTSNTPITPENAALLKAGDWLDHPEWGLAQYQPVSDDDNSLTGPWTYIGPDLGDGWIGWAGGENPDLGEGEVRLRDGFVTQVHSRLRWGHEDSHTDIIAFRSALAKPADHIGDATEKVIWSVVGPKLVEALDDLIGEVFDAVCEDGEPKDCVAGEMAGLVERARQLAQQYPRAALAAAQPQSNGE